MKKIFPYLLFFFANVLFAQYPCSPGFNGDGSESITVPNTNRINTFNVIDRTIEFWFKAPDITTKQIIFEEGGGTRAFIFYLEVGRIYLGAYRNNTNNTGDRRFFRSTSGTIEVDKWYHVALTLESTPSPLLKWYLNGVEQDSQTGFTVESHSGTISFATNGDNLRYPNSLVSGWSASGGESSETYNDVFTGSIATIYPYTGNIALFRIWNVARTQLEIDTNKSSLLTSGTDIVAYGELDRIYYIPDGGTEISRTAFASVTTQFTTIPNTDAINLQDTEDRTIEFRFRATDLDSRQVLYEEGGNVNAIKAWLEDGRIYFSVYRNNAGVAADRRFFRSGTGDITFNQWYHVALTLDNATTLKWFLDGVEQDSQAGMIVNNHSGDINIGRSGGGMRYPSSLTTNWTAGAVGGETYNSGVTNNDGSAYNFTGDIDLFRIWNVARLQADIDANKNIFLDTGTSLVAYQSGTQINYQPNGGTSPSASEDVAGVITWDGSDSTSWTLAANWVSDSAPSITKSQKITIPDGGSNDPIIASDTNVGFLTVNSGVELIVQSGATLNVYYGLENNGTITVQDGASLIYYNCEEPIVGAGTFNVIRNTRDYGGGNNDFYSYWSSPIVQADATISTIFPDALLIYSYDSSSADANWVQVGAINMAPSVGYAIRNEATGGQVRNFVGGLNSGGFDKTLYFNTNEDEGAAGNEWSPGGDNLLGNPYSSAIDWDLVISDTDNQNIEGTIYIWNQQSASVGDNSVSDYLQYNPTGGNDNPPGDNYKIGTAQAVFTRVTDIGDGNTTTLKLKATHQIAGNNTSATFYKSNIKNKITDKQKGRSWFRLKRGNLYSSILIGFVKGATDNYDRIYDGPFDINQKKLGFYSLAEETKKATIQGLPILTENEKVVPLGFVVDEVGDYLLELSEEYINDSYYIYLEDKEENLILDLNESHYQFTINSVGENNSRFRVIYTKEKKQTLSIDNSLFDDKKLLVYINSSNELVVKHVNSEEIQKVNIYNILGREVKEFTPQLSKNVSDLKTGVYLVKTKLKGQKTITKKIVIAN
ncbi:LamG-like jellyroll fold domain-containing protein [uncultured Polaribacter sp.]|uniref:LamG-like jellyroll fold domain-containing protein n=1 Tax=uncultured Polaribacter sp. TaxID=174711 RepID=UPI00259BEA9D|nr:LamG-like jellyroll fold domain-containing protein [uncultured Polaribacter sp.]